MKAATLNIGKQITLISGSLVYTEKMGSFESIISEYTIIELVGLSKPAKKAKYENLLLSNGFSMLKVYWNENACFKGKNSDVINYRIAYEKR